MKSKNKNNNKKGKNKNQMRCYWVKLNKIKALQSEHARSYQIAPLQINHRLLRYLEKMPSKKHKITRSSFKQIRIEKTFRNWLVLSWPIGVVFDLSTIFINPTEFSQVVACSKLVPSSFVRISCRVFARGPTENSVVGNARNVGNIIINS